MRRGRKDGGKLHQRRDRTRPCQRAEKYADRLLWYTPSEEEEIEEPFPVGIDISDSLLVTKYKVYPQHAALGIGVNSTRLDAAKVFLDFIFVSD